MFHISPKTGAPQICTAQKGSCPYRHFGTYEEARLESDRLLSDFFAKQEYGPLEMPDDIYHSIIMRYGKDEIIDLLSTTEDKVLLSDVFHQKTSLGKNPAYFKAILHNPNLPDEVELQIFRAPYNFSIDIATEYTRGPLVTRNWDTIDENWGPSSDRKQVPDYIKHLSNYHLVKDISRENSLALSRIFQHFPFTENDIKQLTSEERVPWLNSFSQEQFKNPPFSSIFLNRACSQSTRDSFEQRNNCHIEYEEKMIEPLEFLCKNPRQPY